MSKRYPPIYSIVAIIALVILAATNTNGAALYVASTIVKTLATLTSNIANYLGFYSDGGLVAQNMTNQSDQDISKSRSQSNRPTKLRN